MRGRTSILASRMRHRTRSCSLSSAAKTSGASGMKAVVACVSLALALVAPGDASIAAEDAPAQSLRIIVPLSAGSAFDILARAMGKAFKQRTQQPAIVENRP